MLCQDDLVALGDLGSSWLFELVVLVWLDWVHAVSTIKDTVSRIDDPNLRMSSRIGVPNNNEWGSCCRNPCT